MAKAISYTRFSALHQGKGSTTERQRKMIAEWLAANPKVSPSNLSQEDIGKSGFKGEHLNHGLGKILEAIKDGKVKAGDYILVEAIDRIGRLNVFEMFEIFKEILSNGVTIVTLEDEQKYTSDVVNDASKIFLLIGKIQQAHDYSKNLSRRLLAAHEAKRKEARNSGSVKTLTPFWLTNTGKLHPRNSEIVKACIELYLKGRGTRRVILELMDQYPELEKTHPSTLKRWFQSIALIGEWKTKGEVIPKVFEPLISNEKFYLLQRELKNRTRNMSPEQTYSLSGLVACEECNGKYYFRRKKHNDSIIIYANCSTYLKRGERFCKNKTTWPYEVLQYILQTRTPEQLKRHVWNSNLSDLTLKIDELNSKKAQIKDEFDRLIELYLRMPKQPNLAEKMEALEEQRKSIEAEIVDLTMEASDQTIPTLSESTANSMALQSSKELDEITKDPIHYRNHLKKTTFQILGNGKTMKANFGASMDIKLTLLRRSTRHKCYVVMVTALEAEAKDGLLYDVPKSSFLAIDKKGVRTSARTERELIDNLIKKTPHEKLLNSAEIT